MLNYRLIEKTVQAAVGGAGVGIAALGGVTFIVDIPVTESIVNTSALVTAAVFALTVFARKI